MLAIEEFETEKDFDKFMRNFQREKKENIINYGVRGVFNGGGDCRKINNGG